MNQMLPVIAIVVVLLVGMAATGALLKRGKATQGKGAKPWAIVLVLVITALVAFAIAYQATGPVRDKVHRIQSLQKQAVEERRVIEGS